MNACSTDLNDSVSFQYLSEKQTNIQFNNVITPSNDINILDFHYVYNGGGVGIADFNNDSLPDIFFGGNQVSSALYINKGNFQFELSNAIQTKAWVNGISIVDINHDGLKDIYLSVGGHNCAIGKCKNLLYINNSTQNNIKFKEQAETYGLATDLYSQQAVFFDADHDGDLDVYQLQNYVDPTNKNYPKPKRYFSKKSYDQFLLNQEIETGKIGFKEASKTWNVNYAGFGLGVVLTDVNNDNYLDVYVANDFISDDLLYVNNEGKSFTESSKQLLKHTSYNSMGVDAGDLNNDGYEEIMVLDMLPYTNARQKTMLGIMNYDKYQLSLKENFNSQYIRNTLQKHNQLNEEKNTQAFTEIGTYSNIYQTDWSWAPLFADFNNDGLTDLYITNGYANNITDLDFVNYNNQSNPFAGEAAAKKEMLQNLAKQGSVKLNNVYFENTGSFKFKNSTAETFADKPSLSNGVAYADLDLDGDLDLVVNNINQPAFVIQNNHDGNYLSVQLVGDGFNKDAIGTKVHIWANGIQQSKIVAPVRGYLSSVEPQLHVGLGKMENVDSIVVFWYDGLTSQLKNVKANQRLTIHKASAIEKPLQTFIKKNKGISKFILKDTLEMAHSRSLPHDFSIQSLLLRQYSSKGFVLSKSNATTNNKSFVFVGSPQGAASVIYKNDKGLQKHQTLADENKAVFDAVFFDVDQDGDEDLYLAYGGYRKPSTNPSYQNELYINDAGNFVPFNEPIDLNKKLNASSCIATADFDKDGDIDLFTGSQVMPQNFPKIPASVFWMNEEDELKGKTIDLLGSEKLGLVADAVWTDIDGNNWQDLIVVGEWMEPLLFMNTKGKLERQTIITDLPIKGLWRCVYATDIDKDGDQDLVLGNFGTNSRLKASSKNPLQLLVGDLDKNGKYDPLMGFYVEDEQGELQAYPYHTRDDIASQLPIIKSIYKNYSNYGKATFTELLSHFDQSTYALKRVNMLESVVLENKGNFEFKVHMLPEELQWSPINTIIEMNDTGDSVVLLLGMNDHSLDTHTGKLDGPAVMALRVYDDFRLSVHQPFDTDMQGTVSSLLQVGNTLLVGDEKQVRVFKKASVED